MIYIIGIMICCIGLVLYARLIRSYFRDKIDATILNIELKHADFDTNKQFKQHLHAEISYYYKSKLYKGFVLLNDKSKQKGDVIKISYKVSENFDTPPTQVEMYAPKKGFIASTIVFIIGALLIGMSHWVLDYFELWN